MNLGKLTYHEKREGLRFPTSAHTPGINRNLLEQIDDLQTARKHFGIAYNEMAPNQEAHRVKFYRIGWIQEKFQGYDQSLSDKIER